LLKAFVIFPVANTHTGGGPAAARAAASLSGTSTSMADFASHERGPSFLTIVAANGVLGSAFAVYHVLSFLLPALFWFSLALWAVLVYGFLSAVTVSIAKPDLEHGLNGAWLLLVVATESIAVLACFLALYRGASPPLVFAAFAFICSARHCIFCFRR
jgi:hypothetical protein